LVAEGHAQQHDRALSGSAARSLSAASAARPASREPITTGVPTRANRSARPKPSAPVPPMIGTRSSDTARESTSWRIPVPASVLTRSQFDTFPDLSSGSFRTVEESIDDQTQLVGIYGDVDLKTARPFRSALDEAASDGKSRLIVDMSEVPFMDSSGLAALIGAQKAFRDRTEVIVVCPENLRKIFEVTRLDAIVSIVGSLPEALVA
jgi:anti-sigma B factor antagonist